MNVSVSSIYTSPIFVWVEDQLTLDYLKRLWGDPDIGFGIAGGGQNVRSTVKCLRDDGLRHIYGLVDRDFLPRSPGSPILSVASGIAVLPRHEIENYLLEPDLLSRCKLNSGRRTAQAIRGRLVSKAEALKYWMATRHVLRDLDSTIVCEFPGSPSYDSIVSRASAIEYVTASPWFRSISARVGSMTESNRIDALFDRALAIVQSSISADTWVYDFSGKELLHDVRDWVYLPQRGVRVTGAERDSDVAKALATMQKDEGCVPADLTELRRSMRNDAGI